MDLAALLDSQWVLVPTIQTMHDGSELRTWGVQANGVWIGRAHPVGPNPVEQALAHRHAALAYRFGLQSEFEHPGQTFDASEGALRTKWEAKYGADGPKWDAVSSSARAGYERMGTFRTKQA